MEDYYLLEAFRWLLETDLESEFYDALIQGYTIQIRHGDGGALDLLFNGPDDKMHIFLQEVLSYISEYEMDEQKIGNICESIENQAKNEKNMEPMQKASSNNKSISLKKFTPEDHRKLILENEGRKLKKLLPTKN